MAIIDDYRSGQFTNLRASISYGSAVQVYTRLMEEGYSAVEMAAVFESVGLFFSKQREIHNLDQHKYDVPFETKQDEKDYMTGRYERTAEARIAKDTIPQIVCQILVI